MNVTFFIFKDIFYFRYYYIDLYSFSNLLFYNYEKDFFLLHHVQRTIILKMHQHYENKMHVQIRLIFDLSSNKNDLFLTKFGPDLCQF